MKKGVTAEWMEFIQYILPRMGRVLLVVLATSILFLEVKEIMGNISPTEEKKGINETLPSEEMPSTLPTETKTEITSSSPDSLVETTEPTVAKAVLLSVEDIERIDKKYILTFEVLDDMKNLNIEREDFHVTVNDTPVEPTSFIQTNDNKYQVTFMQQDVFESDSQLLVLSLKTDEYYGKSFVQLTTFHFSDSEFENNAMPNANDPSDKEDTKKKRASELG